MRWISKDDIELELTAKWHAQSAAALLKLAKLTTAAERSKALKAKSAQQVWRDYYECLPAYMKIKCWYCEGNEIRSSMPVDHFKPKGAVDGVANHEGYWWLAFDWENYRCACEYCNSRRVFAKTAGGKQNKFPIVDENQRAFVPTDNHDLEEPAILDPFNLSDTKSLWFDDDGKSMVNPHSNSVQTLKVINSIDIFHLDEIKIVRKRHELRITIEREVKALRKALSDGDAVEVRKNKEKLMRRTLPLQAYSRAAIVYLSSHRDLREVKEILHQE
ncbi:hypothetical protein [Pseudomonas viridiflava]|uniref:hypothetical protein n=2 Tax=Pseudomonas viridiflava TaxID=33069 RepID=UPI000F0254B3|nr:hypothetical protein [Pseudomonas viridiflava]